MVRALIDAVKEALGNEFREKGFSCDLAPGQEEDCNAEVRTLDDPSAFVGCEILLAGPVQKKKPA